jgi:hypothetical protein
MSNRELFLKYKIKSAAIKYGWYILLPFLTILLIAAAVSWWILFCTVICAYPAVLMAQEIKVYKKELKELSELDGQNSGEKKAVPENDG